MDGKDELQLLPGTKKRLGIKVPGQNRFLYIGSAILGAAIVTAIWFNFDIRALENQVKNMDEQLFILEQKRDKKAEENIQTIRQQISLASQLVNEHIYTTKVFSKLESLLQENMQVKSIGFVVASGKLSMLATAGSYTTIARQIVSFLSDDSITDIEVGEMKPNSSGVVEFNLSISYNQAKLFKKIKTQ